jgi:hypothetical protein
MSNQQGATRDDLLRRIDSLRKKVAYAAEQVEHYKLVLDDAQKSGANLPEDSNAATLLSAAELVHDEAMHSYEQAQREAMSLGIRLPSAPGRGNDYRRDDDRALQRDVEDSILELFGEFTEERDRAAARNVPRSSARAERQQQQQQQQQQQLLPRHVLSTKPKPSLPVRQLQADRGLPLPPAPQPPPSRARVGKAVRFAPEPFREPEALALQRKRKAEENVSPVGPGFGSRRRERAFAPRKRYHLDELIERKNEQDEEDAKDGGGESLVTLARAQERRPPPREEHRGSSYEQLYKKAERLKLAADRRWPNAKTLATDEGVNWLARELLGLEGVEREELERYVQKMLPGALTKARRKVLGWESSAREICSGRPPSSPPSPDEEGLDALVRAMSKGALGLRDARDPGGETCARLSRTFRDYDGRELFDYRTVETFPALRWDWLEYAHAKLDSVSAASGCDVSKVVTVGELLGTGTYGRVFVAALKGDRSGFPLALKLPWPGARKDADADAREARAAASVNLLVKDRVSPNFSLLFHQCYLTDEGCPRDVAKERCNQYCILTELAEGSLVDLLVGRDSAKLLSALGATEPSRRDRLALSMLIQLLLAIAAMSTIGLAHNDASLANVLYTLVEPVWLEFSAFGTEIAVPTYGALPQFTDWGFATEPAQEEEEEEEEEEEGSKRRLEPFDRFFGGERGLHVSQLDMPPFGRDAFYLLHGFKQYVGAGGRVGAEIDRAYELVYDRVRSREKKDAPETPKELQRMMRDILLGEVPAAAQASLIGGLTTAVSNYARSWVGVSVQRGGRAGGLVTLARELFGSPSADATVIRFGLGV